MSYADLIPSLLRMMGDEAVLTGALASPYCKDWRGRYSGDALAVVFPSSTSQVSEVVKLCAAHNIAIVPQGGNTSLCGGSVPLSDGSGQLVLNLSRMNKVRAIDTVNYTMTVEAGCKLADVREAAEKNNRFFPLGLTATQKFCEIGGNLSTNAGGINVLRYGTTRELVLGVEVVLPDGRIWNGLRSLRKDNSGYDLKQLFVGAEGTLGIITAAVLKLFPRPQAAATACVAVRDPAAAVALLSHLRATCGDKISSFEIISRSSLDLVFRHIPDTLEPFKEKHGWIVLTQLADVLAAPLDEALSEAMRSFGAGIVEFDVAAGSAEHWWMLRKNISEAQKREGLSIKHDVSVPVSRVADFIACADAALYNAFPGIRIVAFGHMGDGNIHYNASMPDTSNGHGEDATSKNETLHTRFPQPNPLPEGEGTNERLRESSVNAAFISEHEHEVNRIVYEMVKKFNGSISAEHGLGQLKREAIREYKDPLEMELMQRIKQALDPQGLMNPGKVI